MSKLYPLNSFYIKTKFKNHKKLKKQFLDLIDQMPNIKYDTITKSDYNSNTPKTYEKFFYYYFEEVLNEIGKVIKSKDVEITSLWFQQYYKKDNHQWHTHPRVSYSNIYYLELPESKEQTQFFNLLTKKPYSNINIKEGDIITFNAAMPHRSKTLLSDKRKTVIVFNSNYKGIKI